MTKYNSIEIKLETITVDFETALINALREIFKNIKIIGCYFHYMQALDRNARKLGFYKEKNRDLLNILKDLGKFPFLFTNDNDIIDNYFKYIKKENKNSEYYNNILDYEIYFKNTWIEYFKNGMLNYNNLEKFRRSNSYLENYNKHIKSVLNPFLLKTKNYKVDWIIFIGFIISEEEYRNKVINNYNKESNIKPIFYNKDENEEEIENSNIDSTKNNKDEGKKLKENSNKIKEIINHNIIESLNEQQKISNLSLLQNMENWIQYDSNSCRYDSFFFIYCNVIYPYIHDFEKTDIIVGLVK